MRGCWTYSSRSRSRKEAGREAEYGRREKRLKVVTDHLNAGRDRVAKAKLENDALDAKAKAQPNRD